MITPDNQLTLFLTSKVKILEDTQTAEAIFCQWFHQGLISFDLSKIHNLQEPQRLECVFVSSLFNSKINFELIKQMLAILQKPYSYDPSQVYFNVFKKEWFYLPIENVIDEDEIISSYFENLSVNEIKSKITDLVDLLELKVIEDL